MAELAPAWCPLESEPWYPREARWSLGASVAEVVFAWCLLVLEPWCPLGASWSLRTSVAELLLAWRPPVPELLVP